MKNYPPKFWLIFGGLLAVIIVGYYFTTYKTLGFGKWNFSGKIDAEIFKGLDQDVNDIARSLGDVVKQVPLETGLLTGQAGAQDNGAEKNNSTSTENVLIEKIKTKINQ